MRTYYDSDLDYLEVFFGEEPNHAEDLNDFEMVFKSEKNDSIIGYAFEKASKMVSKSSNLSLKQKIGAMAVIARKKHGVSQEEASNVINIPYRTYQRIEEGEIGNIDYLEKLISYYDDVNFSELFKKLA